VLIRGEIGQIADEITADALAAMGDADHRQSIPLRACGLDDMAQAITDDVVKDG
jgi:hypothetical protein